MLINSANLKSAESLKTIQMLLASNFYIRVGPVGLEPTTHGLKERLEKIGTKLKGPTSSWLALFI